MKKLIVIIITLTCTCCYVSRYNAIIQDRSNNINAAARILEKHGFETYDIASEVKDHSPNGYPIYQEYWKFRRYGETAIIGYRTGDIDWDHGSSRAVLITFSSESDWIAIRNELNALNYISTWHY